MDEKTERLHVAIEECEIREKELENMIHDFLESIRRDAALPDEHFHIATASSAVSRMQNNLRLLHRAATEMQTVTDRKHLLQYIDGSI